MVWALLNSVNKIASIIILKVQVHENAVVRIARNYRTHDYDGQKHNWGFQRFSNQNSTTNDSKSKSFENKEVQVIQKQTWTIKGMRQQQQPGTIGAAADHGNQVPDAHTHRPTLQSREGSSTRRRLTSPHYRRWCNAEAEPAGWLRCTAYATAGSQPVRSERASAQLESAEGR